MKNRCIKSSHDVGTHIGIDSSMLLVRSLFVCGEVSNVLNCFYRNDCLYLQGVEIIVLVHDCVWCEFGLTKQFSTATYIVDERLL